MRLSYAMRSLRRHWRFALLTATCLAVGIGASTAAITVVDVLFFRLPSVIHEPERVLQVFPTLPRLGAAMPAGAVSHPAFQDLRRAVVEQLDLAAFADARVTFGPPAHARDIDATMVSANYFHVLGLMPFRGRFFLAAEEHAELSMVVVLDHAFWRLEFSGDDAVIGQPLEFGPHRYTVIGVAPPGVTGPDGRRSDVWLTLGRATQHAAWPDALESRSTYWLRTIARLRHGATLESARQAGAQAMAHLVHVEGTASHGTSERSASASTFRLEAMQPPLRADWGLSPRNISAAWRTSGALAAGALGTLLLGATNAALLFLLHGFARQRELATRMALGASRRGVASVLITEFAVIAALALPLGVGIAFFARNVVRFVPATQGIEIPFDPRVLILASGLTIAAGFVASVVPAFAASGMRVADALKGNARASGGQLPRLRRLLLVVEIAGAFVLVSTSVMLFRTSRALATVDVGMAVDQVAVITRAPGVVGRRQALDASVRSIAERARQIPWVRSAALGEFVPFRSSLASRAAPSRSEAEIDVRVEPVDAGYFATLRIPLLAGRAFDASEVGTAGKPGVAIVNDALARAWWGADRHEALGKCVVVAGTDGCARVIGVAGNVIPADVRGSPPPIVYLPSGTQRLFANLFVRTDGLATYRLASLRQLISAEKADGLEVLTMRQLVGGQARVARRRTLPFVVSAAAALTIAAFGVFALVSYAAQQRTTELAIRSALGAGELRLCATALSELTAVYLIALPLGVLASLATATLVGELLFGVSVFDPLSHATTAIVLSAVGLAASTGPVRRVLMLPAANHLRGE